MFIAIAGNPNSGKTTAFNKYTGSRQRVGNYPGITVEKKEGPAIVDGHQVRLIDLPGTYSLTAYSLEEVVARNVLVDERPGCVLDIVNAAVLERNLYLTLQLLEMGVPVVLALNMMDEARAQGIHINIQKLEELMGVKAVSTVARTGEGLEEALRAAVHVAKEQEGKAWKPLDISYGIDIDTALQDMIPLLEQDNSLAAKYPMRWVALKVMENDSEIIEHLQESSPHLFTQLKEITDKVTKHLELTQKTYPEAIIAEYRYGYISSLLRQGVISSPENLENRIARSDKIDSIVTHKFFGPIIMLALLYFMYWTTFVLGDHPKSFLENLFEQLGGIADMHMADGLLKSLVIDGIIAGVGGVLSFVPLILIMFLFISCLEDLGYMARVAYMWDRVFRIFGLHGASVMPFIISGGIAGGCAVPGVMATRTLRSPKERLATMLTAPFMTCGAKLPVFLLFVGIFFKENQEAYMFGLTLTGWAAALLVARLLRSTLIKGESTPFVMELPPYRIPTLAGVLLHTWERGWMYVKKAGTIILAVSVIIWAGMTFPSLPDDLTEKFAMQKAPFEEKLAEYDYGKYAKEADELKEALEGISSSEPRYKELKTKLSKAEENRDTTALGALLAEIEEKSGSLEEMEGAEAAQEIKDQYDELASQLEEASDDAIKVASIQASLTELEKKLKTTKAGDLLLTLDTLNEKLEATPEKILLDEITKVENEESSTALRYSIAGRIGTALETVSKPAGFDWKTNIALVGGIAAKEVVVSTLGTGYSLGKDVDPEGDADLSSLIAADPMWTKGSAMALLLFSLLYSPCFVTVVMIKQESGSWKWALFSIVFNLLFAYIIAVLANQIISAFI